MSEPVTNESTGFPKCFCGETIRLHPLGGPCTAPYSQRLGFDPVRPVGRWPTKATRHRRAVFVYVRVHVGVQAHQIVSALGMSREWVRKTLDFLESRRLILRTGPSRQSYYYPAVVGGKPVDAARHFHRHRTSYGPLVRMLDQSGELLLDHLVEATGWRRIDVERLVDDAVRRGAIIQNAPRAPGTRPTFRSA